MVCLYRMCSIIKQFVCIYLQVSYEQKGAVSLIYIYISNVQKTSVRGECKLIKVMKEENTLIRGGVVDCR